MAKKEDNKQQRQIRKITNRLTDLNKTVQGLFRDMNSNISGYDASRNEELQRIKSKANQFADNEINSVKGKTAEDISKFYFDLSKNHMSMINKQTMELEEMFGMHKEALYQIVDVSNKNKNNYYDRLSIIAEHLHELDEAVATMRDSVITADDLSNRISRSILFNGLNEEDNERYTKEVEKMELELSTQHKIKAFIVPQTLTLGTFYSIDIPYSYIFDKASMDKSLKYLQRIGETRVRDNRKNSGSKQSPISESYKAFNNMDVSNIYITESSDLKYFIDSYNDNHAFDTVDIKTIESTNIGLIMDEQISPMILESFAGLELSDMTPEEFENKVKKSFKPLNSEIKRTSNFVDGTISKKEKFDEYKGCYSKLVDPRKLLPIEGIGGEPLGYLLVHEPNSAGGACSPIANSGLARINASMRNNDKLSIVNQLTESIYREFSKKFLANNIKFKDTIAQALLYNDYYSKGISFQFIPVEFVTKFTIDEDMDGFGTSMLKRSLFKAHLYLGMYIFKYMSSIDRSNDTRIHYVRSSSLDNKTENQVQKVIRQIVERTPSYSRMTSYSGMMDTLNVANRDIVVPTGKEDVKGIEFDVLSGQDVQMNNDFLEDMRTSYINASGVPSVIMSYVNEADYAKTLVMANSKMVARSINYQLDFNPDITEWYKKLMKAWTSIPEEVIAKFEFKFIPPKSLILGNTSDLISSVSQTIEYIVKTKIGENADTELENVVKDILADKLSKVMLPMLPWNQFDDMYEDALLEATNKLAEKKNQQEE